VKILTHNILEDNSTIVMTNADANYPVENIYSNMLEELAQANASSTVITIDFTADQIVDCLFLGMHNASSIIAVFKNSAAATLGTVTLTLPTVFEKRYIDTLTTVRSIEITLTAAVDEIFIGNFSCGEHTELHNVRQPMTVEHKDTSMFNQTLGGQTMYNTGITLQSFNVDLEKLTDTQVTAFKAAYAQVHKGKCFWLDRYNDIETEDAIYGIFDANFHTTRNRRLTDLSFSFTEAK